MSHNRIPKLLLALSAIAVLVAPLQVARADTGPKPTMQFDFVYEVSPAPAIVSGVQFECSQPDCSDAQLLMEAGPQRFGCSEGVCSSLAYGYSDFHRLSIEFSDGVTRQSNVFGMEYFEAVYKVTVRQQDLLVEEQRGGTRPPNPITIIAGLLCVLASVMAGLLILLVIVAVRAADFRKAKILYIAAWLVSLLTLAFSLLSSSVRKGVLITLAVEMALALGYVLWRKRPPALVLTVVFMMNLSTRPVLSFIFGEYPFAIGGRLIGLLVAEFVIWLVEAGILAVALRKQAKFLEALLLSLILNAASFGVGFLLPF